MTLDIVVRLKPDEPFMPGWEDGITRVVGRSPSIEIRDPAFLPREANPVVEVRTEDGGVIWREGDGLPLCSR